MLRKLILLIFVLNFSLATTSCAPAEALSEEDVIDNSDEASEFRKTVSGSWQSGCISYTEGANLRSDRVNVISKDSMLRVTTSTYGNGTCRGTVTNNDVFEGTMRIRDASSASRVIMEIVNKTKKENAVYRQTLDTTTVGTTKMTTKLIGISIWEDGSEKRLGAGEFNTSEINYTR